ncbi:MAG: undecaprenyldiphospho-muramoylpentapeptide beta-N-acetylglucosaminyltransferase [Sphingomonadales bacterium]|nr:undecaprenyldiphospho-muramoylpentapeptide beta-N-acetylglucosaminyltransferase [Sphingomonadales bacterium]
MSVSRNFVLAAGGTGGHIIPAYALGAELMRRGHQVALITDNRGSTIPGCPEDMEMHIMPAGRVAGGLRGWLAAARNIWRGRAMARELFNEFDPTAVVGFGGYPALPALLAAFANKVPTIIHEQNAVLGRVNRLVAGKVNAIATAYPDVQRVKPAHQDKVHLVGNPVRAEVIALRDEPFPPFIEDGVFRVLVTGGSQGASILSEVVPDALARLPLNLRRRLQVTQQCRAEDLETVRKTYADHNIPAQLATYLEDFPERLGWSHLVIGRAGASTIAELTCAGRPAILVPLPSAMDNHQAFNVSEMVQAGGARAIKQSAFTPVELAKQIQKMALIPETLQNAARAAKSCGRPDAVHDLADLVESFGRAPLMHTISTTEQSGLGFGSAEPALARKAST